jgi:rod shape-determining protein MreC
MNRWLHKHAGDAVFCTLSLAAAALLFLPVSTVTSVRVRAATTLAPLFALVSPPPAHASSTIDLDADAVALENTALRADNAKLAYLLSEQLERDEGLDTLRKLYEEHPGVTPESVPAGAIPASLIARPTYKARSLYVLDKGADDGVETGAGVICRGAAVGRVVAVSGSASLMAPVTHPACQVPAWIVEMNVGGQLKGADDRRGFHAACLNYVPRREAVQVGMRVVTSGLEGAFPPGVLLGTVSKVAEQDAAFHDLTVEAALPAQCARDVWILPKKHIPLVHEKQGTLDETPK